MDAYKPKPRNKLKRNDKEFLVFKNQAIICKPVGVFSVLSLQWGRAVHPAKSWSWQILYTMKLYWFDLHTSYPLLRDS